MVNRLLATSLIGRDLSHVLANGREVIQVEGRALLELSDCLDDTFVEAVSLLVETKQRVIVSGMGKSGHVARKIAATLASTGTPALFVHPAEAAHGDLGMITQGDLDESSASSPAEIRTSVMAGLSFTVVERRVDPKSLSKLTSRPASCEAAWLPGSRWRRSRPREACAGRDDS